jgi:hypothetical protein
MQPLSLAEALVSEIIELKDPKTKEIKKSVPQQIFQGIRNKSSDFILAPVDFQEYLDLVACLVNYSSSPSPVPFSHPVSAANVLANPKSQKSITMLLGSSETHVVKLLDPGLPGNGFINAIPKSKDGAYGLSADTLDASVVLNMGGNAADLGYSPFWLCLFQFPWGETTNHLSLLMTNGGSKGHQWFMDAFQKLGATDFAVHLNNQAKGLVSQPLTREVVGKLVRFPLSSDAAQTDNYISISPLPSATMVVEFKNRYFDAIRERKALSKEQAVDHVFAYPESATIGVGGANTQNCGSTAVSVNGEAKAFLAFIPSQSFIDGRQNGRLFAKLQSGRGSLVVVDRASTNYLLRKPPTSALRLNWQSNLPDVVADILAGLIALRENGIPAEVTDPRFAFSIERDFVLKSLVGDKQGRSLTPNDLHLLGLHVRDQIQYQIVKRTKGLGLDYDRQEQLYSVVIDLLR